MITLSGLLNGPDLFQRNILLGPLRGNLGTSKNFMINGIDPEGIEIPAFQTGGVVRETGIALVHEGEYIMPAPGSEAVIEPAHGETQTVINYYFPVEVVIIGSLPEEEKAAIEARIWENLSDALDRAT